MTPIDDIYDASRTDEDTMKEANARNRLRFGIRLGSQLGLLDQSRRRIAPRHVHLDQPDLVGLVERLVAEQLVQLFRRVHLDRLVWDLGLVQGLS